MSFSKMNAVKAIIRANQFIQAPSNCPTVQNLIWLDGSTTEGPEPRWRAKSTSRERSPIHGFPSRKSRFRQNRNGRVELDRLSTSRKILLRAKTQSWRWNKPTTSPGSQRAMTTDTPRTDEDMWTTDYHHELCNVVNTEFAQQLERELAASKAEVERLNAILRTYRIPS